MTDRAPKIRVVKVGGSLLDWPELPSALRNWLANEEAAANVLLCGGGRFVEEVREADRLHALGNEAAHWLAIDCLTVTARLLATICQLDLVREYPLLRRSIRSAESSTTVFDPRAFLIDHEATLPGKALSHDWTATSDSIAARLAQCIRASELVLLKSSDPPNHDMEMISATGYVDEAFGAASQDIPLVRMLNLRAKQGESAVRR